VSGPVPGRGTRQLTRTLRFQVLRVSFEIVTADPEIERTVRFLAQSAAQPQPARTTVFFEVRRREHAYEISRNGCLEDVQFDPVRVLETLARRVQHDALEAWPEAAVLRAVTGERHGERFILVGDTHADRARVALELIGRGADIQGDDLTILHEDGMVTAYPRPLRVYGENAPLPVHAPPRAELPFLGARLSTRIWALDLALTGIDWRITTAPCDTVILLEINYGGQTRITEVPHREMARILMSWCDPLAGALSAIRMIARLLDGAQCCRLRLGSFGDLGKIWPGQPPDWYSPHA
jgi:hypothetical protein